MEHADSGLKQETIVTTDPCDKNNDTDSMKGTSVIELERIECKMILPRSLPIASLKTILQKDETLECEITISI